MGNVSAAGRQYVENKCAEASTASELKVLRRAVAERVDDATRIPWPALAASFKRDLDMIDAKMAELAKQRN